MRRAFVAFPLLLILLTYAAGQTTSGEAKPKASAEDEVRIKEVLANFIEAWNKHDAKAFSMVFAEDTDFTNAQGECSRAGGRREVSRATVRDKVQGHESEDDEDQDQVYQA